MKRLLQLSIAALVFTQIGCKKEESFENEDVLKNEQYGKFKREIIVNDESGRNSVFIAIYSDFESAIEEYVETTSLKLIIETKQTIDLLKNDSSEKTNSLKSGEQTPNIEKEHSVTLDIVKTNFTNDVNGYSLQVERKHTSNKSANFIYGNYSDYVSSSDFVGVVHLGTGYDLYVTLNYKENWGIFNWKNICKGYVESGWSYYIKGQTYDTYKTAAGVYLDARQNTVNYKVIFSADDFRSRDCEIGTYSSNVYGECYVGTAPEGTNAFFWGPNSYSLNFYYTPLNGNQCPRAGSYFDGANCFAMDIPAGCEPYIWQRNWLIKSKKIN